MPVNWALYPHGWQPFAAAIKHQRAACRCECTGECGLHQPNPTPRRCTELHGTPARWFRGRVRLTVAHLCNCDPLCMNPDHVKAMCQRCHLRVDRYKHAKARLLTQRDPIRRIRLRQRPPGEPPWPGAGNARQSSQATLTQILQAHGALSWHPKAGFGRAQSPPGARTSWRAPCSPAQPISRPASRVQAHPPDPLRRRDSP